MAHNAQTFKFKDMFEKIYSSTWTIWIIIAAGIYIRVVQYIANRSLWFDEAMLSLNIVNRSFHGLLQTLNFHQAAPIGFLFLEKLAVSVFGPNEYSLRLLPLLSGVIALFVFYKVCKLYIKEKAIPIAVLLFSISYPLIQYSSEVKQYSTDVCVALILYLIASPFFSKENGNENYIIFGFVGGLSVWISFPSVFILAGVGSIIFILYLYSGKSKEIKKLTATYIFWIINFAIVYYLSFYNILSQKDLVNAWKHSFAPSPFVSFSKFKWYFNYFCFGNFYYFFGNRGYMIAAFLFFIGFAKIFTEKNVKLAAIFSPIIFLLIASALHKYPGGARLALFLISGIILIASEGALDLISKYSGNIAVLVLSIFIAFFSYPIYDALKTVVVPIQREEIKPAMKYISENFKKDDTIYIYYGAVPAFRFYSEKFNIDKNKCIEGSSAGSDDWNIFLKEIEKLRGKKRVWVLFSHLFKNWRRINEEKFLLFHLNMVGQRSYLRQYKGASVWLYDLTEHKMAGLKDP